MLTKNLAKKIKVKGQVYVLAEDYNDELGEDESTDEVDAEEMTYDDLKLAANVKDDGMGALDLYMAKYFRGVEGAGALFNALEDFENDVNTYVFPAIQKMKNAI